MLMHETINDYRTSIPKDDSLIFSMRFVGIIENVGGTSSDQQTLMEEQEHTDGGQH
ncbi:hypothetical protein DPMN_077251 [Dreissena polymorpha]|uniref:Uncharacterized protein n=1 Tax=Dreissena polymorpha TaxID=45954 RepID=A0A9D4BP64_DREPO|nr:hypothetical protein DPMN_077251 [Dreissena polymorpha]